MSSEEFEESCEDMGGEVKELKNVDMEVCVVDGEEMAITSGGHTVPVEEKQDVV